MNRTEHELELMRIYLEGFASLKQTKELESLIVKDSSVRQDFLRYMHLDSALAGVRRSQPRVVATSRSGWFSWRHLAFSVRFGNAVACARLHARLLLGVQSAQPVAAPAADVLGR
jgi:hypothetical protein